MAKYIGLRVKFRIPEFFLPIMEAIDNQSVAAVIRESMRSAGRPAVIALKSLLKSELIKSDQSTGATERAVTMKYGRSKRNGYVFYLVVGIDKKVGELHTSKVPDGQITRLKRGREQRGAGLFATRFKRNSKGTVGSKQVFSRYRNSRRIAASGGKPFKRIPGKYFHMIDRGFNHYRAGRVGGYNFIAKLQKSLGDSMQILFEARIKELIIPTIQKEMIRKLKGVLK